MIYIYLKFQLARRRQLGLSKGKHHVFFNIRRMVLVNCRITGLAALVPTVGHTCDTPVIGSYKPERIVGYLFLAIIVEMVCGKARYLKTRRPRRTTYMVHHSCPLAIGRAGYESTLLR